MVIVPCILEVACPTLGSSVEEFPLPRNYCLKAMCVFPVGEFGKFSEYYQPALISRKDCFNLEKIVTVGIVIFFPFFVGFGQSLIGLKYSIHFDTSHVKIGLIPAVQLRMA